MSRAWTVDILRLRSVPLGRMPTSHLPEHRTLQGQHHVCNQLQISDRPTAIAAIHIHNSFISPGTTMACLRPVLQSHTRRVVHIPFAQTHRPQKPNAKHYKRYSNSARHTDLKSHVLRLRVAPARPRHHHSEQGPLQRLVESRLRGATVPGLPNQPTASTRVDKKPLTIWRTIEKSSPYVHGDTCAFRTR
jgi:hypothetical protein